MTEPAKSPSTSDAYRIFREIMSFTVGDTGKGACGIDVSRQFQPESETYILVPQSINAAFLIALCGENHPNAEAAREYLDEMAENPLWTHVADFYREGLKLLADEFGAFYGKDGGSEATELVQSLNDSEASPDVVQERLWRLFHPEAVGILENEETQTRSLREKRKIRITRLNQAPVKDIPDEVLFTANALLTVPPPGKTLEELDISPDIRDAMKEAVDGEQHFWYDHPVQIGVEPEKNEILYGLKNLSEALLYEKARGTVDKDKDLTCVLSASVTHESLHRIVKEYMEWELQNTHDLPGLNVYLFTEADAGRLIHQILVPAAQKFMPDIKEPAVLLREVVGVDGRYGRHYSFLKAIAALWHVLIDPRIRATFKIDLDQVFPQENLLKETGRTAFEHLKTPLWGAEGTDSAGNPVHLGMVAGALVNDSDLKDSLFTPDVKYPSSPFKGEDTLFLSKLPQALSTVAEMMTKYPDGDAGVDGNDSCIHRIHVTGGTNGILIDALRKYRPFTPVFVGRAEDQAYLLSVLFPQGREPALRYLHKDGLFMRHDKESFAGEAIRAAAIGKLVGDYERVLLFSNYARSLPWGVDRIKEIFDPFTGSFISHMPLTIVYLRLALKAATFFDSDRSEDMQKGLKIMELGSSRLSADIHDLSGKDGRTLGEKYEREKRAWDLYYDILDHLESGIKSGDAFALELREKARQLIVGTKLDTE
ncbi:MAG: hypothetical protein GY800_00750 [Planctomycetes bacterium]|nr:hypothetical protein [Planctomycetota bacterium]